MKFSRYVVLVGFTLVCGLWARTGYAQQGTPSVTLSNEVGVPGGVTDIRIEFDDGGIGDVQQFTFTFTFNDALYGALDLSSCTGSDLTSNTTCSVSGAGEVTVTRTATQGFLSSDFFVGEIGFPIEPVVTTPQTDTLVITSATYLDSDFIQSPMGANDGSIMITPRPIVTVGASSGAPGDTVTIPLDYVAGGNVGFFGFRIAYDPSLYSFVDLSGCTFQNASVDVSCTQQAPGTVDVSVSSPQQTVPTTNLGSIDFTIDPNTPSGQTDPLNIISSFFSQSDETSVPGDTVDGQIAIVAPTPPEVTVGTVAGLPGATVTIPIDYIEGTNVTDFQFTLAFDPTLYSNVDLTNCVTALDAAINDGNASCAFGQNPGEIVIAATETAGDIPTSPVGTIDFSINTAATPQTDVLSITGAMFFDSSGASLPGNTNDGQIIVQNDQDGDGDGVADNEDNCPDIANADQADLDLDGTGDICDVDIDGDGIINSQDPCPRSAANRCNLFGNLTPLSLCEDEDPAPVTFDLTPPATINKLFATDLQVKAFALADFNGDGRQDLAVAGQIKETPDQGWLSLFIEGEKGDYRTAGRAIKLRQRPVALETADFNNDQFMDVAVANQGSSSVSILMNDGFGAFVELESISVGDKPVDLVSVDFNGDGFDDLVVANRKSRDIGIWLNNENTRFTREHRINIGGRPTALAVADLNQDGLPDIAVTNANRNKVSVLFNDGFGGVSTHKRIRAGQKTFAIAADDFDGDGDTDLAASGENGVVFIDNTSKGLRIGNAMRSGSQRGRLVTGDLNGDGWTDLVAGGDRNSHVTVWINNQKGQFGPASQFGISGQIGQLLPTDVDGDGQLDLMASDLSNNALVWLENLGAGEFSAHDKSSLASLLAGASKEASVGVATLTCVSANAELVVEDDPQTSDTDEGPVCISSGSGYQLNFDTVPDANTTATVPLVNLAVVLNTSGQLVDSANQNGQILPVNDAPSFSPGSNIAVTANSSEFTQAGWATDISAGADNESDQSLEFVLTPENAAAFTPDGQPAIDPVTGDLTFVLDFSNAQSVISQTVSVQLFDNGATDAVNNCAGHENASEVFEFEITGVSPTTLTLGTSPFEGDVSDTNLYTQFDITNTGASAAVEVILTSSAPPGLTYLDLFNRARSCTVSETDDGQLALRCDVSGIPDSNCNVTGDTLVCTVANLPAGQSASFVLRAQPSGAGPFTVTAKVSSVNADSVSVETIIGN